MSLVCPRPNIIWQDNLLPYDPRFEDNYYSSSGGLSEARAVFLSGCNLPDSWQQQPHFTIAELGFGTGLNFAATWQLWASSRRQGGRLHYLSIEHQPLEAADIDRALGTWPELAEYRKSITSRLPPRHQGFHQISWPDQGVWLTLAYGPAMEMLTGMSARVNAWFLDGFAPSRNPEMWTDEVFQRIAELSAAGAIAATYSCARQVRHGLADAGFEVLRKAGFGLKRERIVAHLASPPACGKAARPWFANARERREAPESVTIVGAGISGRCLARSLTLRGIPVLVLDSKHHCASKVPVAMVKPRLTADFTLSAALQWSAFLHAGRFYQAFAGELLRAGALDLLGDTQAIQKADRVLATWGLERNWMERVSATDAAARSGLSVNCPGVLQRRALSFATAPMLERIWPQVDVVEGQVHSIQRLDQQWLTQDYSGKTLSQGRVLVIACGLGALDIGPWDQAPLTALKGQLSGVTGLSPRVSVARNGFVTPAIAGYSWLGATYDHVLRERWKAAPVITEADHQANFERVERFAGGLSEEAKSRAIGFAGLRAVTPDHIPIAGPAPDWPAVREAYSRLHFGESWRSYPSCPTHEDLFGLTGMGSRGYLFAPLLAELVASQICGEPWPVARLLADLVHPVRFELRRIRRGGNPESAQPGHPTL